MMISYYCDPDILAGGGLTTSNFIDKYFSKSDFYVKDQNIKYRISSIEQNGSFVSLEQFNKLNKSKNDIADKLVIIDEINVKNKKITNKFVSNRGKVFPALTFYQILSIKLSRSMKHVRNALRDVQDMFEWDYKGGFKKKIANDVSEKLYIFKSSELKEHRNEKSDEYKLQSDLLNILLTEIGIPSLN